MKAAKGLLTSSFIMLMLSGGSALSATELLDQQTRAVLEKHCARCHSPSSKNLKAQKDIPDIFNIEDVIARKMLVPGDLDKSKLWTEVAEGSMPDDAADDFTKYPSEADKDVLKQFVLGVKDKVAAGETLRVFISDGDILKYIFDDIANVSPEHAKYRRYFLLTHFHNNASVPDKDIESHRLALTKMLNSLSWKRNVVKPDAVDPERTILRIDLREIGWTAEQWEKLASLNPYNKFYDNIVATSLADYLGTTVSAIRADWFVAKVSRPPLYHEFAQIPETVAELEKTLLFGGVTAEQNRKQNPFEVVRAGMRNSGVSAQNRMIERHPAQYGAYWLSYDFKKADPSDPKAARRDFFRFPTGPDLETGFQHDGGEFIFNLPNGFQAYMLADAEGKRIDEGPTDIVFDRNAAAERRNPTIVNGLSCISCHASGMNRAQDELLDHVRSSAFDLATQDEVALLHDPRRLADAFDEDERRFKEAMARAGIDLLGVSDEPVTKIVNAFEETLVDVRMAAAELGFREEEFRNALSRLNLDNRIVGIKQQLEGSGMPREQFIAAFDQISRALRIGRESHKSDKMALADRLEKMNALEESVILSLSKLDANTLGEALRKSTASTQLQLTSITSRSAVENCADILVDFDKKLIFRKSQISGYIDPIYIQVKRQSGDILATNYTKLRCLTVLPDQAGFAQLLSTLLQPIRSSLEQNLSR